VLGHDGALLHLTSHLHESMQVTAPHEDEPTQSILHTPVPHVRAPHAAIPEQATSQPVLALQSMVPQALVLVHLIVQSNPAGHATAPHVWLELQSIAHVLAVRSQDVHWPGHAAGTQ
jgi:hypothetical protein